MKKIILLFLLLFSLVFSPYNTFASTDAKKIGKLYSNFTVKLDRKYSITKQISTLTKLQKIIYKYLDKELSTSKEELLKELSKHNNNYLFSLFLRNSILNEKQKSLEFQTRLDLKKELKDIVIPNHIQELRDTGKRLYLTNKDFDFVDEGTIKKVRFTNYYPLESNAVKQFYAKEGIIVYSFGDKKYRFISNYTLEEKVSYSDLEKKFNNFIIFNANFTLENNNYYGYIFKKFSYIEDSYGVFLSDLERLGISSEKELLYKDKKGQYLFVKEYKKRKLISKYIIDGIPNKEVFLEHVRNDKRDISYETDTLFLELKNISETLTKRKKKQEKIEVIYDWVLKHLEYTKDLDIKDVKIFSGIDAYKNKDGVCTGYSKLTSYMLMFGGITDTEVIRGDVIDAQDFPDIGHAWLKIGDSYYDPTFDDPIGAKKDKERGEYKYYNLPKDILYTNRYNFGDTPEAYKKLSLLKREKIVAKKLFSISEKYKQSEYLLIKGSLFRKKYDLSYDVKITPKKLSTIIPLYEVKDNNFKFQENGKTRSIKSLKYFVLDENNTERVLKQLNYKIENLYFFLWEKENEETEYRLAYEIKF